MGIEVLMLNLVSIIIIGIFCDLLCLLKLIDKKICD